MKQRAISRPHNANLMITNSFSKARQGLTTFPQHPSRRVRFGLSALHSAGAQARRQPVHSPQYCLMIDSWTRSHSQYFLPVALQIDLGMNYQQNSFRRTICGTNLSVRCWLVESMTASHFTPNNVRKPHSIWCLPEFCSIEIQRTDVCIENGEHCLMDFAFQSERFDNSHKQGGQSLSTSPSIHE